jgi:hypothetical protein
MPKTKTRSRRKTATQDIKPYATSLQEILLCYPKAFWDDVKSAVEAAGGDCLTLWEVKPIGDAHQVQWSHASHAAHLVWLQMYSRQGGPILSESAPKSIAEALAALGLPWPCTRETAKASYRAAIKAVHPDAGGCEEQTKAINAAWENLERYFDIADLFTREEV